MILGGTPLGRWIATTILRPYIRHELPGWGRLYAPFIGGWEANADWADAPPQVWRNKLHGRWFVSNMGEWSDRSAYFLGRWYDLDLVQLLNRLARPGDTVIDIGANYGHFTLAAEAVVGREGKVISFEPNPASYGRLVAHAALNPSPAYQLHPFAVADAPGEAVLSIPDINSGEASLAGSAYAKDTVRKVTAPVVAGDEFLRSETPRLIKIDVEGFEVKVLTGLKTTLARARPYVVTEVVARHLERAGDNVDALVQLMDQAGYRGWRVHSVGSPPQLRLTPFAGEVDCDALWAPKGEDMSVTG